MSHAEAITALEDYEAVAWDLSHLIPHNNQDIIEEFGIGATAFTGDIDYVVSNLKKVAAWCKPGERQQFIGFSGEDAVGVGRLAIYSKYDVSDPVVAEVVDVTTPNFGVYVCNPYRGTGVGRALAQACRRSIQLDFNDEAWTVVDDRNVASQRTVERMGFRITHHIGQNLVYAFTAQDADYL